MPDLTSIFKAYDVKGRTEPGGLTEDAARAIGAALTEFVTVPLVAVGRDCRLSSPGKTATFIDSATSRGADVLDLGEVATDVVYYVSGVRQVPVAMITASHNPQAYNWIKMCREGAAPIGAESGLEDIRRLAESTLPPRDRRGTVTGFDPIPGYVDHLLS